MKSIPQPVLQLLLDPWKPTEKGYSAFETSWDRGEHRRQDPSFYHYRTETPDHDNNGFKGREVKELAKADVFAELIREGKDGIALNEHAQHALSDFCSEVYDAWNKFNERLSQVRNQ